MFKEVSQGTPTESVGAFIREWNAGMCAMGSDSRATFFNKVQAEYDKIRTRKSSDSTPSKDDKRDLPSPAMVEAYVKMLSARQHVIRPEENEPQLAIAFDEAHPLSAWQGDKFCPSHILCRAISNFSRNPRQPQSVWVVFASMTSKVADFSAPQAIHNSQRVSVAGQLIFPPYVQLGWDQGAAALGHVAAGDISKVNNIIRFGRPLRTSLNGGNPEGMSRVINVACIKRCKSLGYDTKEQDQALAVLSQRFCLDMCFGHPESVRYLEALVASHLHVCSAVAEDRTWKFTSYPSQPFLSCVAASRVVSEIQEVIEV
ncbi:hypothetical protein BJ138DRAFT_1226872 [Hygrophoropsis aurantiaca]|uniref:Uncharacterized protein n=1 Tax=Hygrophoropsis aurantiaca TaxID=72124 RepID=A0ACB7ZXZ4_9AGAM|nr:hypothetical protein BJ138DRAFT_1226872 [Hygrophoropsis aurantiaca]